MIKTFKYKLYNSSNKYLISQIEIASEIYNHCISLYKNYYKLYNKFLNKYQLQKHITKLKKLNKYSKWRKLPSQSIQDITDRIDKSYKLFFKKQTKHSPSYKSRYKYKSFSLKQASYKLFDDNQIIINKRKYKYFKSRSTEGEIKLLTIKRDILGDLYLYIICKVETPEPIYKSGKTAGIDFGCKQFLTLSDDTTIDNPEYLKNSLNNLKSTQQVLSRKKRGSNNKKKIRKQLSRLYNKITNQRTDFLFKLARKLCYTYDELSVENLDLNSMKESKLDIKQFEKNYHRKLSDLSYGEFLNILTYYCEKTGKKIVKIDRFFPSSKTCSNCGYVNNELKLTDRTWTCPECKEKLDRDINASKNIERVGTSTLCEYNYLPEYQKDNYDSIESHVL